MVRLMIALALLLAGFGLAQEYGSSLDFEVGYQHAFVGEEVTGGYGMVRANLPLALEVAGAKAWLLPETGLFFGDGADAYLRVQLTFDAPYATLFTDCRADLSRTAFCRAGARFNTDW